MLTPSSLRREERHMRRFGINITLSIVFVLTVVASQAAQAQTYKVIYNFTGGQDGALPYAGVTMDGGGNLYGTTSAGTYYGTVYQLKHKGSGWVVNVLYTFQRGGSDGYTPFAGVVFGPDGTLYGTTWAGGMNWGTVFNLRPSPTACKTALCPWQETVLYAFKGAPDPGLPYFGDL